MTKLNHTKNYSVNGFLLAEIQNGATIQSLMDKVYDKWYCPSLFLNISRIIEYYSKYSSEINPWDPIFENGMLDLEYLNVPIRALLLNENAKSNIDHTEEFSAKGQNYIITAVRSGNVHLGFLLMHTSHPGHESEIHKICDSLSKAITFLMEKEPSIHLPDYNYARNYVAQELLQFDERIGNLSPAAGNGKYMTSPLWPFIRPNYRIAAISGDEKDSSVLKAIDRKICQSYSKSFSLIKASTLYLFFYRLGNENEDTDEMLRHILESAAESYSVNIALSSPFADIDRRQVYRRQALDLSRISASIHHGHKLIEADDCYPEQMLYAMKNRIGSETMMLSELAYLRDYDEQNGTEYLHTLCSYLRSNGIVRKAAAELHIEPKSLRYRIQKISDIIGRSREDLLSDKALLLSAISCSLSL